MRGCKDHAGTDGSHAGLHVGAGALAVKRLEEEGVIVGYPALINWDKTSRENVKAIIEVRVTPQRDMGFDAIAERIYRFEEVKGGLSDVPGPTTFCWRYRQTP